MRAFVTGATGQDGQYLLELLAEKGYEVTALVRRVANRAKVPACRVVIGDVTDATAVSRAIAESKPDEVYNLAAQSHVGQSFDAAAATFAVNALGALHVLEAARAVGARFYQASSSEVFGSSPAPQNELTPMHPRSPYGVAKLAAYWQAVNYREAFDVYACNGILFNHESPRRGGDFVTQKVVRAAVAASRGSKAKLRLGNLEARRDWGHASDYVRAMWMMLQQPAPGDYVVGTGESRSVAELCDLAYRVVGLDWRVWVESDPALLRPSEVADLCADARKMRSLGWQPEYTFHDTIRDMIYHALRTSG